MPEQKELQGLLGQFGIDTRSQQAILAERAKKNWAEAMNGEYQERYPGDAGMQRAGAAVGTALSNKFNNKLTEKQQIEQASAKEARQAISTMIDEGNFLDADGEINPVLQAQAMEKEMAKSLLRRGDQRGMGMLSAIHVREKADAKDGRERVSAELDIEAARQAAKQSELDWSRRFVDEIATVYPIGSTDANDRADLYIDSQGRARNPDTMDIKYEAGEWSQTPPITPKDLKAWADGEMTDEQEARMPNQTSVAAMKKNGRDIFTTMNLGIDITSALRDAVNPDGSLNIMSTGGKLTEGTTRLLDNLAAAAKGISETLVFTDDAGNQTGMFDGSLGSSNDYVKKHKGFFEDIPIPDSIDRTNPRAVTRYQALLVQYAYAKARLNEPNGRISDADFEHGLQQIAAASSDPEALRLVLAGDVSRNIEEYEYWVGQIDPTVRHLVITEDEKELFKAKQDEWNKVFKDPFGGPNNVQGALLRDPLQVEEAPSLPTSQGTTQSVSEFLNGGYSSQDDFLNSFIDEPVEEEDEEKGVN